MTGIAGYEDISGEISIHTTTQVVTASQEPRTVWTGISIHTTTQVVTIEQLKKIANALDFNPHHHAGGDHSSKRKGEIIYISIHTTTQVVTGLLVETLFFYDISIHTTTQVVTPGILSA